VGTRRTGWLLLAVLAAHLALLAAGVPASSGEGTVLEAVGLRLVGPPARLITGIGEVLEGTRERLRGRQTLLAENRELREEVERLRFDTLRLHNLEVESRRLATALEHVSARPGELVVADIVYLDHTSWLGTLILHAGEAPLHKDQPVVTSDGLIGRVIAVAGAYARVQLIIDRGASVGAMLERSGQQGVLRGRGRDPLELAYIPLQADVEIGDAVVTAGIDGVYPQGIPIGTVVEVAPGDELFRLVLVAPAVDFSRMSHAYLLQGLDLPRDLLESETLAQP